MPNVEFIEKLAPAEHEHLLEVLEPAPCPTAGCTGTGMKVRILDSVFVNVCDECAGGGEDELRHAERVSLLLRRSGITARLAPWSLDTYPTDDAGRAALKVARGWLDLYLCVHEGTLDGPCPNLLLYGPVGGGKTGLAWGIVRGLIDHEIDARIVNFPDLLDQMREAFARKVPFDSFSSVGSAAVLALDDVGAERPTEWAVSQLLALVDKRHQRCLPTIYTSNYDPDDLVERLTERLPASDRVVGERIVSRMTHQALQHRIKSPDRRTA